MGLGNCGGSNPMSDNKADPCILGSTVIAAINITQLGNVRHYLRTDRVECFEDARVWAPVARIFRAGRVETNVQSQFAVWHKGFMPSITI